MDNLTLQASGQTLIAIAPNIYEKSANPERHNVSYGYKVMPVKQALEHVWVDSEAAAVTYIVRDSCGAPWPKQPRLNKDHVKWWLDTNNATADVNVFFADYDNGGPGAGHHAWSPDEFADFRDKVDSTPILAHAGIYATSRGARIIQPWTRSIPIDNVEMLYAAWLTELEEAGLSPNGEIDPACKDWTRHYTMPNVRKGSGPNAFLFRSPWTRFGTMRSIDIWPSLLDRMLAVQPTIAKAPKQKAKVEPVDWTPLVSDAWRSHVPAIADAIRADSQNPNWHLLFMAVAGALIDNKVPYEQVPALCEAISLATVADNRTKDRVIAAKTTVQKAVEGRHYTSSTNLSGAISAAIYKAAQHVHKTIVLTTKANAPLKYPIIPLDKALQLTLEYCTKQIDTLKIIQGPCGFGKTKTAVFVASERAKTGDATSFCFPTHELAIETQEALEKLGVPYKRVFSPLSYVDPTTKKPLCKYYDAAKHFEQGGYSIKMTFCNGNKTTNEPPCQYKNTCAASNGFIGDKGALVTLGSHAMMHQIVREISSGEVLFVDEPPETITTSRLTAENCTAAIKYSYAFYKPYANAMRPIVEKLRMHIESTAATSRALSIVELFDRSDVNAMMSSYIIPGCQVKPIDYVDPIPTTPPLERGVVSKSKYETEEYAKGIGMAAHAYKTIAKILFTPDESIQIRIEEIGDERVMLVLEPNVAYNKAIQRCGNTIVLDANAEIEKPFIQRALGKAPDILVLNVADKCPVERTHIVMQGSRNKLLTGKKPVIPTLHNVLSKAIDWALEHSTRLLSVISFKSIISFLKLCQAGKGDNMIKSVLDRYRGTIKFAHYGALRGLDKMKKSDALVTIGDPRPNINDIKIKATYCNLESYVGNLVELRTAAELGQAQGRLRTIHSTQSKRALHIGQILPDRWGDDWGCPVFEKKYLSMSIATPEEAKILIAKCLDKVSEYHGKSGKNTELARVLDVSERTIRMWISGDRTPTTGNITAMRHFAFHSAVVC